MSERLYPLTGEQRPAVDPAEVVWLSASAGTGKTQVLSARVLRLLLQDGVRPGQILCLTFTKAGATEMASRINEVLARWVRADEIALAADLRAVGADYGPAALARARRLFAEVLDCPGGGLRIDTIHAFAQWLLSAFPGEAGLLPGVKAMEDRERDLLIHEVLADLLIEAERSNDAAVLAALAALSERLGPDAVPAWLLRCAAAREAWEGPGGWQPPMRAGVLRLVGLPGDASEGDLAALSSDDAFPVDALECCLSAYRQWNGVKGQAGRAVIADWLAAGPDERVVQLPELHKVLFTQKDTVKDAKSLSKFEEHFEVAAQEVLAVCLAVRERQVLLKLVGWITPALELGWKFSGLWREAKARAGFIDFDDQIRQAADLLGKSELAPWIAYKLDRRFDHILVDEAQDTNAAQWEIIKALVREYFAGEGMHGDKLRTLFVVGDYKQAIFRFQGTSPENFRLAMEWVKGQMAGAAGNAAALRENRPARELQELGLGQSFRTAEPILGFVDRVIGAIGFEGFGLDREPEPHVGEKRPGQVVLWQPVGTPVDEPEEQFESKEEAQQAWLAKADRQLADRIARQVRDWMARGFPLVKGQAEGKARRAGPGDVMVLVRKRKDLAGLIVARLHARGVPVAGVDRLRLGAPLAVRDLMAALRFAAQPLDELNLACLLVSPLIGWSQEELLEHGWRDEKMRLWDHLREQRGAGPVAAAMERLLELLRIADFEPPQALLHWLLIGPWQGRKALITRLGSEANDPIDELLNAASAYAASNVPSLNGFIRWFDAGEGELKREASKARDEVRVMTVHGSKGLQAPIVILADATDNPDRPPSQPDELDDPNSDPDQPRMIPLPTLKKELWLGRITDAAVKTALEERQEHWRLLYVAMTRAEEALFIGGALGNKVKEPVAESWFARIAALFNPGDWQEDPIWGGCVRHGSAPAVAAPPGEVLGGELPLLPPWAERAPPAEPRPPRPLAPSSLGEEFSSDPPFPPGAGAAAAQRGVLLHKLLERLPEVEPAGRKAAADLWLAKSAADLAGPARAEIAAVAVKVLENKHWAELFAPGALAEVPIAAAVGGQVIAGTIDRLLIGPTQIRLVDFKSSRRPPAGLDEVPVAILRQMAAYSAALEAAYPGREVAAALLYTQVPKLIELPAELLALHKQALTAAQ